MQELHKAQTTKPVVSPWVRLPDISGNFSTFPQLYLANKAAGITTRLGERFGLVLEVRHASEI
jgi:hypothetical protein